MFIQFSTDRYVKKYQVYQIADRFTIACAVIPLFFCVRGTLAQDNSRLTQEHLATTHFQEHMVGWRKRPAAALVKLKEPCGKCAWRGGENGNKQQQNGSACHGKQMQQVFGYLTTLNYRAALDNEHGDLFLVLVPVQWLLGCISRPPLCFMASICGRLGRAAGASGALRVLTHRPYGLWFADHAVAIARGGEPLQRAPSQPRAAARQHCRVCTTPSCKDAGRHGFGPLHTP